MRIKLGDVCSEFIVPQRNKPTVFDGNIPWCRIEDITHKYLEKSSSNHCVSKETVKKMNLRIYPINTVLFSCSATIGTVAIVKKPLITNQTFIGLVCDDSKISYEWLYYYLMINKHNIANCGIGSTIKYISKEQFENFEIDLPDRKTQDKIAEILSGIDEQINRNNEVVKKLQVLGHTIYSDTFKDCKTTCSLMNFPYIRLIKQGINEFKGEKHYIATADVADDNLNLDTSKITFDNREGRANMQPVKNSVWFAQMKNSIKHIFISSNDDYLVDNYIFSTGFYGFECDEIVYEFMIGTLSLPYFEQIKDKMANGAIMASINSDSLNLIKIPMPTEEQLSSYHEKTKYIYMQISVIKTENYKLSKLKERLLPLLINGQLSI